MKLTKIAIALVAVLAMSAVVASGASAKQLTSPNFANASITAKDTGNHVFTVDGQNVTCTEANFNTGTIAVPANEITVNAVYNGCTAFGLEATVNMGNCDYKFTTPTKLATDEFTSTVDVVCNGNTPITVVNNVGTFFAQCEVKIGQNTGTNHVIIKNTNNAPKDLSMNITVSGITATKNKDNGLCPLSGTGTVNNATYNGTATATEVNGHDILLSN